MYIIKLLLMTCMYLELDEVSRSAIFGTLQFLDAIQNGLATVPILDTDGLQCSVIQLQ